jgi:hypothetical protein
MTRYEKMDEITGTVMEYCGIGLEANFSAMTSEDFVREVINCLVWTGSLRPEVLTAMTQIAREDRADREREMIEYDTAI